MSFTDTIVVSTSQTGGLACRSCGQEAAEGNLQRDESFLEK